MAARPQNDRSNLACPHCKLPARKTICSLPVGMTTASLLEVWYCMDCKRRFIIATYIHDDFVQVLAFNPQGWFAGLPPPWGLPRSH